MKIRTQKDVDKLELQIKNELGIDVNKYKNEEVVENFVELLLFPQYVTKWVIRPIVYSILLYIIGFFIFDLVHIEYLIYAIIGFGLFFTTGLFFGLIFLLNRMRKDMWGIIDYSIGIMNEAILDLKEVNHNVNYENLKYKSSLLFKGVLHIITIPLVSKLISEKIPFVGGIVNRLVKSLFFLVSDKIILDDSVLLEYQKEDGTPYQFQDFTEEASSKVTSLEKVLKGTFRIAKFPLILGFIGSFFSLVLFLYLIN